MNSSDGGPAERQCVRCGSFKVYARQERLCYVCFGVEYQRRMQLREMIRRRRDLDLILPGLGVPRHFAHASFETCDSATDRDAKARIKAWARNPKGMLLIRGEVGRGKTFLATAAFRLIMRRPVEGRWVSTVDMLSKVRAGWEGKRNGWHEGDIRAIQATPVLLLDDIGSEFLGDRGRAIVAQIIAARYNEDLSTILTTNMNVRQLAATIDYRTASRAIESVPSVVVGGGDRRDPRRAPVQPTFLEEEANDDDRWNDYPSSCSGR